MEYEDQVALLIGRLTLDNMQVRAQLGVMSHGANQLAEELRDLKAGGEELGEELGEPMPERKDPHDMTKGILVDHPGAVLGQEA